MILLTAMQSIRLGCKKAGIPQPTLVFAATDIDRLKVLCKKVPDYKYIPNEELGDVIILGGVAITWPQKKKAKIG